MKTIKRIIAFAIIACMLCFLSGIEAFATEQIPLNETSVSVEIPIVKVKGEVLASTLPDHCLVVLTGPTTLILDEDKTIAGIDYHMPSSYNEGDYWYDVLRYDQNFSNLPFVHSIRVNFDADSINLEGNLWYNYLTLTVRGSKTLTIDGFFWLGRALSGPEPSGTLIMKSGNLIVLNSGYADTVRVEGGTILCCESDFDLSYRYNNAENYVTAIYNYDPDTSFHNFSGLVANDFFMTGGELKIEDKQYGLCAYNMDISGGRIDIAVEETAFDDYYSGLGTVTPLTCNVNITGGNIIVKATNDTRGTGFNANTFTMTGGTLDASGGRYAVSCWGDSVVLGNNVEIQSPNGAYAPLEKSEETGYSILNEDGTPATRVLIVPLDSNATNEEISVIVNGKATGWTDATPFIDENNRTMVPLRAVGDALGLTVDWDNEAREAVFTDGAKTIYFPIGSKTAHTSEGSSIEMDTAAIIVNERTYAPIRYLAEFFDCSVDWDGATRSVILKTSGQDDESGLWTFRYDSNGADGAEIILPLSVPDGHVRVVRGNEIYKTGYAFNGWNTMPDGSGDTYAIYDEITIHKNIILYAQWKPIPPYGTNGPHPATYEELKAALLSDAEWIYVDADITYDGPANGELRVRGNKFLCIDKDATIITTENFAIDQIGSTLAVREAGGKLIAANVSVPW